VVPHHLVPTIESIVAYAQEYPEGFVLMNANPFAMLAFVVVIAIQLVSIVLIVQWVAKSNRTSPWSPSWEGLMWVCTMHAVIGAFVTPCLALDFSSSVHRAEVTNPFILWGCVWVVLYVMLVLMACGLVKLTKWAELKRMTFFVSVLKYGALIAVSVGTALLTMCFGVDYQKFFQIWRDVQRMRSLIPWLTLGTQDILHEKTLIAQCLFLAKDYGEVLDCGRIPSMWQRVMDTNFVLFAIDQGIYFLVSQACFACVVSQACFACGSVLVPRLMDPQYWEVIKNTFSVRLNLPHVLATQWVHVCTLFLQGASIICPPSQIEWLFSNAITLIGDSFLYLAVINIADKVKRHQGLKMPSKTSIGVCAFAAFLVLHSLW